MDNHTKQQRHENMSHIRAVSKIEDIVRKNLFAQGFRYRKNDRRYPGCPDIVLPKYKTVVFVNGCFWHRHPGCSKAVLPSTNQEYWLPKLNRNIERDKKNYTELRNKGWNVIVIWECQLKKESIEKTLNDLAEQIKANLPIE